MLIILCSCNVAKKTSSSAVSDATEYYTTYSSSETVTSESAAMSESTAMSESARTIVNIIAVSSSLSTIKGTTKTATKTTT